MWFSAISFNTLYLLRGATYQDLSTVKLRYLLLKHPVYKFMCPSEKSVLKDILPNYCTKCTIYIYLPNR